MKKFLLALSFILAPALGLACSCSFHGLDDTTIQEAKHIFAFRLLSVAIDRPGPTSEELLYSAVGTVEVVETLRGNGAQFQRVRFSTFACCGTRLDVGHTYVAFVPGKGPEFEGNISTLLVPSGDLTEIVAGRAELPTGISERTWRRISHIPPPPPPVPCPQKD